MNIDFSTKLLISKKAHLILPTHRLLDAASEASKGKAKIGSTLKGIGPTYMDKTGRNGMRVGDILTKSWKDRYQALTQKHLKMLDFHHVDLEYDLNELETQFFESIETLKKCQIVDSENFLHKAQDAGKKILAEGAQGSLLDVDFGTYPFVTSSTTTAAGACTGLGVAPNKIKEIFGIFKAYTTRVGSGPFPTELFDDVGKRIAKIGHEFGATTGRARRCGWIDLVALKYAIRVNGVTQLMMMKGDVLSGLNTIKVCNQYKTEQGLIDHFPFDINPKSVSPQFVEFAGWEEDLTQINSVDKLPKNFIDYIHFLERELQDPYKNRFCWTRQKTDHYEVDFLF
jgi:adenylosuccinate synthase